MTTTKTQTRNLTATERDRLLRLRGLLEEAKDFTQSSKRLDRLNAFEHRLMDSGVSVDELVSVLH